MKKLILTALDDNDDIWFNCFIPFILTLQNTDYKSDIGVISYGLSDDKRRVLLKNNIHLFEAKNICNDLSLDRFISTAYISQEYDFVALYDADIWFPKQNLTLFDNITDTTSLYCSYDVILPPFLLNGVKNKSLVKPKLDKLLTMQTHYWQAGVTIGTRYAWREYANFIIDSLKTGNYQFAYGIDTTLLNLYSIEFGRIKHLHEKYNCLPFWGIQIDKEDFFPLKVNQEEIEGLHITRFHRDTSDFSFLKISADLYLHSGSNFSISQSPLYHYQECGELFLKVNDSNGYPFRCNDLFCHSLSINRFNDILSLETIDTFEMKLTYVGETHCQIKIGYRALLNRHLPIKVKCYLNNREIMLLKDSLITLNITPNDELVIQSLHIRSDFGVDVLMQGVNIVTC